MPHLQAMEMINSKLFLIFMLKDQNLAQNWTNLAKNMKKKKIELQGNCGACFFQLWSNCPAQKHIKSSMNQLS